MNKRRLHHYLAQLRHYNVWYLLAVVVVLSMVAVYSLRQNNLTMIRLRDTVYQADAEGGDVESALRNLRQHVHGHMNTNLASGSNAIRPPIQLEHLYGRLVQAEKDRVSAANAAIYTEGQKRCEAELPGSFSGGPRVACVQAYVESHSVKEQPIPTALYQFDFLSPTWSPDLAGLSLLIAAISFSLFVVCYGLERWLEREVN